MANRPAPEKTWYSAAAKLVVRNNLGLRAAAQELDIAVTAEEADKISKQKVWQDILWAERHRYTTEIANVPGRTKTSLIGLGYIALQELMKSGDYDKVLEGIQKLARLEGWDKSAEVNIFAGVTSADIDSARKEIEKQLLEHTPKSSGPDKSSLAN